jgi:hypothetical protein
MSGSRPQIVFLFSKSMAQSDGGHAMRLPTQRVPEMSSLSLSYASIGGILKRPIQWDTINVHRIVGPGIGVAVPHVHA